MSDISILVLSCDAYSDTWLPFFALFKKYWEDCPFETYILTEEMDCPYCLTIKHQGSWTSRVRNALQEIPSKYVFILLDDFFIRREVDTQGILRCFKSIQSSNTACISFEREYAPTLPSYIEGFRRKTSNSPYLNSCMPSIWNKEILISRLQGDFNPWEWETSKIQSQLNHFVSEYEQPLLIDIGYYSRNKFGLCRGKWVKNDVVKLFKKEDIEIDFSIRGFTEEKESL